MRIVLLGAPGSGKRTQTMLMVERYEIPPISTGELLKTAVAEGSALGQQVKAALDEGKSVTEEVVLELIHERLLQPDTQKGFVLDGFPRNILQAITLDELMFEMGLPIELALLIDIESDALMERLVGRRTCKSCGAQYNIYINPTTVESVCDLCGGGLRHRADDNEETVSSRLHVYDHLVAPLIKHYTRQQKLQIIDGIGEIGEVFIRICQAVDTHEPPPEEASALLQREPEKSLENQKNIEEKQPEEPLPEKAKPALAKKKSVKKKKAGKKQAARPQTTRKKNQPRKKVPQRKKLLQLKKTPAKKKSASKRPVGGKKKVSAKKASKVKKQPQTATKKTAARKKVVLKKKKVKKQPVRKK